MVAEHAIALQDSKVIECQKLLSETQGRLEKVSSLADLIGSRFEDYKNIFHELNPWLPILKDSLKQNLDVGLPSVQVLRSHGLLQKQVAVASVPDSLIRMIVLERRKNSNLMISLVYIQVDVLFDWKTGGPRKLSIFSMILESFFPSDAQPIFALRNDFGISLTRQIPANQSILTLSLDTNPFVLDGTRNVPTQLLTSNGFSELSQESRIILSIAVFKVSSDEFSNPFSLLWKGVGVRPIPDVRWVLHRGIFALGVKKTGLMEIDRHLAKAHDVIGECQRFLQQASSGLDKILHAIDLAELRWAWLFLTAFGVSVNGVKILEPHLLFARRTLDTARACVVRLEDGKLKIFSHQSLDRGAEIMLDASDELSDGFALLFHGSWVADESIHRGQFWVPLVPKHERLKNLLQEEKCTADGGSLMSFWLSNDARDLERSRDKIANCLRVASGEEQLSAQALEAFCDSLKLELIRMEKFFGPGENAASADALQAVQFHYFNLLYSELVHWESVLTLLVADK